MRILRSLRHMEPAPTYQTFSQSLPTVQVAYKRLEVRQDCCRESSPLDTESPPNARKPLFWDGRLWGIRAFWLQRTKASVWPLRVGGRALGQTKISQGSETWGIKRDLEHSMGYSGMRGLFLILFWVVITGVYTIVKMHFNEHKNCTF